MTTLKNINARMQTKYPDMQLVKGSGYFYIVGKTDEADSKLSELKSTSIYTNSVNQLSLERWVLEIDFVLKPIYSPQHI